MGRIEAEMEVVIDSNKIISAVVSKARGYCLIALLLVGARPCSEEEQLLLERLVPSSSYARRVGAGALRFWMEVELLKMAAREGSRPV